MAARRQAQGATLRVTQIRSGIGHRPAARATVRALGLHRLNQTVEIDDTPANRGMLRRVAFLVRVEEPSPPSPPPGEAAPAEEGAAE